MELSIQEQLFKMKITYEAIDEIRSKDGVYVYRIKNRQESYVLKCFEKEEFRREINNYLMLKELGIKTIPLIGYTDKSILMMDIENSKKYRLGTPIDMKDAQVCTRLAEWYHLLHKKGKAYVKNYGNNMYMESDCITAENIEFIKNKTQTQDNEVWNIIDKNLNRLYEMINSVEKTLTYNDFYYPNMVVAKDKSEAFMFDYNLLGKGYIYSDIKNVTWGLGESAKKAFLDTYGKYNENKILLHEVVSPIISLYFASHRDVFPKWACEELQLLKSGNLLKSEKKLFNIK